ncbi:MAG: tetratricopeptide repeat protein [Leptospirillum sp.]
MTGNRWKSTIACLFLSGMLTACSTENPPPSLDLLRQSSLDIQQHRLVHAEKILDRLKKTMPEDPTVWNNLATVAFLHKDYARSLRMMDRALALKPSSTGLRMNKARLLLAMGKNQAARTLLRKMIRLRPWPKGYRILLAIAEKRTGHIEAAAILFEELIANHPDDPLAKKYLSGLPSGPGKKGE